MSAVVILLGAPGSGKGTQAVRLAEALGLPHVSTGDLFRANIKGGTELGERAQTYMNKGELVPDEVVLDMLFDRVAAADCRGGYILDGFPRTEPQALALQDRLSTDVALKVAHLVVGDEVIVERASGRLLCRACGNIQHAKFQPPATAGVCDACGGELYQREDDRAEVVRERLRVYHTQTAPLVRFYEERGLLTNIDGERAPDAVFQQLMAVVENDAVGGGADRG